MWTIWILRNEVIFKNGKIDFLNTIELIMERSWSLFLAKNDEAGYSYSNWCISPIGCVT